MSNHKQFMKALEELLKKEIGPRDVIKVQIRYGSSEYVYLSEKEPPSVMRHLLGIPYETWYRKTKNGWYIWSY